MDKEFKIISEHVTFYSSLYKKKNPKQLKEHMQLKY